MENLGQEEPFGRTLWKVLPDGQPHPELAAIVGGVGGPVDDGLDGGHVLLVEDDGDALHGLRLQALKFASDVSQHLRIQIFHI